MTALKKRIFGKLGQKIYQADHLSPQYSTVLWGSKVYNGTLCWKCNRVYLKK